MDGELAVDEVAALLVQQLRVGDEGLADGAVVVGPGLPDRGVARGHHVGVGLEQVRDGGLGAGIGLLGHLFRRIGQVDRRTSRLISGIDRLATVGRRRLGLIIIAEHLRDAERAEGDYERGRDDGDNDLLGASAHGPR